MFGPSVVSDVHTPCRNHLLGLWSALLSSHLTGCSLSASLSVPPHLAAWKHWTPRGSHPCPTSHPARAAPRCETLPAQTSSILQLLRPETWDCAWLLILSDPTSSHQQVLWASLVTDPESSSSHCSRCCCSLLSACCCRLLVIPASTYPSCGLFTQEPERAF